MVEENEELSQEVVEDTCRFSRFLQNQKVSVSCRTFLEIDSFLQKPVLSLSRPLVGLLASVLCASWLVTLWRCVRRKKAGNKL